MEHNDKLYLTSDESVLYDDHYRYKISIIYTSSMLKKGTYITILDNFESFCNELLFDKIILIKIVGKLLSCKSGINKYNQYYLQGLYNTITIKQILYNFIKTHLLCINCDKPEINLKYKNNKLKQKCRACGSNVYLLNCSHDIINTFKNL